MLQDTYIKAYRFAAMAHRGQWVPGSDLPYVVHLSFVSMEILTATENDSCDRPLAVQCALLHDVIEDTDVTYTDVADAFGTVVADGVLALTKNATLPKEEQMPDSLRRIQGQPREVGMVKLADRITNLQPPPADWTHEKRKRYQAEAAEILEALICFTHIVPTDGTIAGLARFSLAMRTIYFKGLHSPFCIFRMTLLSRSLSLHRWDSMPIVS